MIITGKTILLDRSDDINTDLIIAGKYTKTLDMKELAAHVFEDFDKELVNKINGKIIIAGKNFGCGSSREQAPLALKHSGVKAVVAKSFARIFYRNAVNIGFPVITANIDNISEGDVIEINLGKGQMLNKATGEKIIIASMPKIMISIMEKGGLTKYLKKEGKFNF